MSDANFIITKEKETLSDAILSLPDGSLDFIYAEFTQNGDVTTITISDLPDEEKTEVTEKLADTTTSDNITNVDKIDTNSSTNLLDVIKDKTKSQNSRLDIQNELITSQIVLQSESNELLAKKIDAINQQTKILTAMLKQGTISVSSQIMNDNYNVANNIMQYEKADFDVNGSDDLVDTNNDKIIPMRSKALLNAEKHIDEKRANTTDMSGVLDSLEENHNDNSIDIDIMSKVINSIFGSVTPNQIKESLKEVDL